MKMEDFEELLPDLPKKDLLTIPEVADNLRVSKKTVRRLIAREELLAWKVGFGLRVARKSLFEYVKNRNSENDFFPD